MEINRKHYVKMYSKKGCKPCEFYYTQIINRIGEGIIEKVEFDNDEEVLKEIEQFGMRTVPFIVIGNTVIKEAIDISKFISFVASVKNNGS